MEALADVLVGMYIRGTKCCHFERKDKNTSRHAYLLRILKCVVGIASLVNNPCHIIEINDQDACP